MYTTMYYIWTDHYGYETAQLVTQWMSKRWIEYTLLWSSSSEEKVDITQIIPEVCSNVRDWSNENFGVLVCGTGVGMDMWANKFQGIRSVFATTSEVAWRWKKYDNANVLCLSSWLTQNIGVDAIIEKFHTTQFEDPTWRRSKRMDEIDSRR